MESRKYSPGEKIINEGSAGKEIFFVVSGKLRVLKSINSEETELGELGPNSFFGEMGMLLGSNRTATVEDIEESEVMIGDVNSFVTSIQKDPSNAMVVIGTLARRLKKAHDIISKLEGKVRAYKILTDPVDRTVVESINQIAHLMGLQTIAEYVENDLIKDDLSTIGVDYVQGFAVARPEPLFGWTNI